MPRRIYGASPSAAGPLDSLVAQWFGGFVAKLLSGSGEGEAGRREGGNNKINKQTVRFLAKCLISLSRPTFHLYEGWPDPQ